MSEGYEAVCDQQVYYRPPQLEDLDEIYAIEVIRVLLCCAEPQGTSMANSK